MTSPSGSCWPGTVAVVVGVAVFALHQPAASSQQAGAREPAGRIAIASKAPVVDDTIWVIDITRGAVARTIPAGDEPDGIVFVPD